MFKNDYFNEELEKVITWLERLGYSEATIKGYKYNLTYFFNWLEKDKTEVLGYPSQDKINLISSRYHNKRVSRPESIKQRDLNKFNEYLHNQKINRATIRGRLNIIRLYDKYLQLTENRKILKLKLELKESDLFIKRDILTIDEVKKNI